MDKINVIDAIDRIADDIVAELASQGRETGADMEALESETLQAVFDYLANAGKGHSDRS